MISLRRQTEGLAREQEHGVLLALRIIFRLIIGCVALSGLIGLIIFSFIHWNSFS